MADDLTATLDGWRKAEQAATPGPWEITERHGRDISDEGWSEVRIVTVTGQPVALTYLTDIIEQSGNSDGEDERFIVMARTAMPLLLATVEAVLKLHQPGPATIFGQLCEHHANHRFFSIDARESADVQACQDCEATVYRSCTGCGHPVPVDACPVREAVTRELAKAPGGTALPAEEEGSDGIR